MALTLVERTLVCQDCEQSFLFSIPEQAFYAERGFRTPACCPECRGIRRAERNAEVLKAHEAAGAGVWQDSYGTYAGVGSVPAASRSRRTARNGGGPRFAYPAVCTACGRDTEVPFPPRNGRPVYCRDCFDAKRGR